MGPIWNRKAHFRLDISYNINLNTQTIIFGISFFIEINGINKKVVSLRGEKSSMFLNDDFAAMAVISWADGLQFNAKRHNKLLNVTMFISIFTISHWAWPHFHQRFSSLYRWGSDGGSKPMRLGDESQQQRNKGFPRKTKWKWWEQMFATQSTRKNFSASISLPRKKNR